MRNMQFRLWNVDKARPLRRVFPSLKVADLRGAAIESRVDGRAHLIVVPC